MSIKVEHINKSFKIFKREAGLLGAFKSFFNRRYEYVEALKDVSLTIDKGEIIGILGENGAGKTTLIKILAGLIHPTNGKINVNGFIPSKRKNNFLKKISVVMGQKNQLWWDIPASESFLLNQKIYNIEYNDYKRRLNELVELLNVKEKLNVQVRRLSLGERMKMEIIAALLHNPEIVFLDEPTIGLDVVSQSKIREFVKEYNQKYKTTFLITSHYMNDIQALCKRVFVINEGKGLYDGNFDTLIEKINPLKKLIFEVKSNSDINKLIQVLGKYKIEIHQNILSAQLPDEKMTHLISELFNIVTPKSFTVEELPVEDAMRAFFDNPRKFID
mgnify:CR=1 FL=1|jgi:ABC-2 type transport system ATP-binding protein|tara:strand:+ start:164 stop:1156 length:993 start_codon:yes stop_codon:yes gene_type:complete